MNKRVNIACFHCGNKTWGGSYSPPCIKCGCIWAVLLRRKRK